MHFSYGRYDIIFSDNGSRCLAFCITHFRPTDNKTRIKSEVFFMTQRCSEFIDDPRGLIDGTISNPFIKYSGRVSLYAFYFKITSHLNLFWLWQ